MARTASSRLPSGRLFSSKASRSPAVVVSFVHRLGDHAGQDTFGAVLAAVTGPFDAAERTVGAADHVAVDAQHARLDLGGEAALALHVVGPGIGGEAVGEAV